MNFGFLNNLSRIWFCSNIDMEPTPKSVGAITETPKRQVFFDIKLWGWSPLSFAQGTNGNLCRIGFRSNMDLGPTPKSVGAITQTSKDSIFFDIKLWGWSLLSSVPWAINTRDKFQMPPMVNRRLQQHRRAHGTVEPGGGCSVPLFRPYVAKVPWHKGPRAFLSLLFPRYGHYCGPNWSSGKDNGLLLWDKRPIDWLDFCCYCHDIGYDTHDQAMLLKADLAFLECVERPQMSTKGDVHVAHLYRTMCITGLRNIIIPYRRHLVSLQEGQSLIEWLGSLNSKSNTSKET